MTASDREGAGSTDAPPASRLWGLSSPFEASVVGSPWNPAAIDVPEINGHVITGFRALVDALVDRPRSTVGALLLGEAGSGKTHTLGLICQGVDTRAGRFSFANIHPLIDPQRPLRHLLSEVVASLIHRPPASPSLTQLDCIASRIVARFLREGLRTTDSHRRAADRLADHIEAHPGQIPRSVKDASSWNDLFRPIRHWVLERSPDIWPTALKVFLQYPHPERRPAAMTWLRGEVLDPDDARLLGLGPHEEESTPEAAEYRAGQTLRTLGHLLLYDRPLVVCFDQLDNMDTPKRLKAFEDMLFAIFDGIPSMLVLCSVRVDWWNKVVTQAGPPGAARLSTPIVGRLETHRLSLRLCDRVQGHRLVRARLATLALPTGLPDLFPFDSGPSRAALDAFLDAGGRSPRQILQRAHRLWTEAMASQAALAPAEDPSAVLARWLEVRLRHVRENIDRYQPSEAVLTEALELSLRHLSPATGALVVALARAQGARRTVDLVVRLESSGRVKTVAILVDVEPHPSAVAASLRAGLRLSLGGHIDSLAFVRDGRVPFPAPPRWPVTNQMRAELARVGGLDLVLDPDAIAGAFALVHLAQAVKAGDVSFVGADGLSQTITQTELAAFLSGRRPSGPVLVILEHTHGPGPGAQPCPAPPAPSPPGPVPIEPARTGVSRSPWRPLVRVRVAVSQVWLAARRFDALRGAGAIDRERLAEEPDVEPVERALRLLRRAVLPPFLDDLASGRLDALCRQIAASPGDGRTLTRVLTGCLSAGYLEPVLRDQGADLTPAQVHLMRTGIEQLVEALIGVWLAPSRPRHPADVVAALARTGSDWEADIELGEGPGLLVVGRPGLVVVDRAHRRCAVIELVRPPGSAGDRHSLAIATWLAARVTGLPADGVLVTVGSGLGPVPFDASSLDRLFRGDDVLALLRWIRDAQMR